MTDFIQMHMLTFYPPSNLNRDDTGNPKTCIVGGRERLRISSQCLKRAWRTSDGFQNALAGHLGVRSKRVVHEHFYAKLVEGGVKEKDARKWTLEVVACFASVDKKKKEEGPVYTGQLVHYSPAEITALEDLAARLIASGTGPSDEDLKGLRGQGRAVDIALFGRMLADHAGDNMDAAVQVSHAFSVNPSAQEGDYFTAVDDLNTREETGAGHLDVTGFGSGLFYTYLCINRTQLTDNLGDEALVEKALRALTEAAATVSPSGKQNSFAAQSPAVYLVAEKGQGTPRSLALAFHKPIPSDLLDKARAALDDTRHKLNTAYGAPAHTYVFAPLDGQGTLAELGAFVAGGAA